jgi:hypothetical protein
MSVMFVGGIGAGVRSAGKRKRSCEDNCFDFHRRFLRIERGKRSTEPFGSIGEARAL